MADTKIDYEVELRKLETEIQYWKPEPGKHEVVFLAEPEDTEFIKESGDVVKQWKLLVEVKEQPMVWTIPRSHTKTSLRGQLIKLGAKHGKLTGIRTEILVVGSGKDRRYTIPEII